MMDLWGFSLQARVALFRSRMRSPDMSTRSGAYVCQVSQPTASCPFRSQASCSGPHSQHRHPRHALRDGGVYAASAPQCCASVPPRR